MISTNTETHTSSTFHHDQRRDGLTTSPAWRRNLALIAALMLAMAGAVQASDGTTRLSGVVNLNTADAEQLQMLPGVGEKRAAAIISIRKSKGGFKSVDDLVEVKGVGASLLERLRPHLSVSGKTTAKLL